MLHLPYPRRITRCRVCGSLVLAEDLLHHLSADARILKIIKSTHPKWSGQECRDYLWNICGDKVGTKDSEISPTL